MATVQMDQALADEMVEKAVAYCAEKKFNSDTQQTVLALRQGRCDVCGVLSNCLVTQVCEYLGQMDRMVKAVYRFEPENTHLYREGGTKPLVASKTGINLVAWVDRKSAALTALGNTLENVLAESRRKFGCQNAAPSCYVMDVELVDDEDVQERRGYGIVINNMYLRATQVWSRAEQPEGVTVSDSASQELLTSFDPEFAPESVLFEQAFAIERMPPQERASLEHRLQELKVVLIRKIISDQLGYIAIAKDWFSISDLADIWHRRIGLGKIGGKAAGLFLAACILHKIGDESIRTCLRIPESYFLGSDVIYIFMAMNGLMHWNDQKYKSEAQIRAEYPQIQEQFRAGVFPPEVLKELRAILKNIGPKPLIVRSSSQLEDNFGTSFAGKYNSYFCPNQGTPQENLQALTTAISQTYASTLNPDALLYRRSKKLQDYDERMAVLIQVVQGDQFEHYFLPHAAGVAFSHNLYRWDPQIRREDGFVRLVWGLGTRAVERVGNDFPRLVALSHPLLQPDDSPQAIRHYSQHFVDLIDLESNLLTTMPIGEVLTPTYPPLRYLVQIEQDGCFSTPHSRVFEAEMPKLAITFDEFLRRTPFPALLSKMLRLLKEHYRAAVDIEFTVQIPDPDSIQPEMIFSLLQCRPQSRLQEAKSVPLPKDLPAENIVFSSNFLVPQGYLPHIHYVIYVSPEAYYALPSVAARNEVGRMIGRLNTILAEKSFICVGPGRWGTENTDLGVYVGYSDICNAGALVELAGKGIGAAPEPSLGTHFFQDLMEAQIFPVSIPVDQKGTIFNQDFFCNTANKLQGLVEANESIAGCLHLIDVASYKPVHHLELIMDGEKSEAVAFLVPDS
ncbi:MAG: PEP/pyruvate-binding domain-containing protein [Chloroflexi bacterium]|nr:PEP/pyruvate-binding domain-containing protein [Chloroflexota bacterium]